MPKSPAQAQERRRAMLSMIREQTSCSVAQLAQAFGVTTATVRTDLSELEREGRVLRTHGGVVARNAMALETTPDTRVERAEKRAVAKAAVSLLSSGLTLTIDTGTTALAFAEELAASDLANLRIASSDLRVLQVLEPREDFEVVALGGRIRHGYHFACDAMTLASLDMLRSDFCIVTTTSLDVEEGFSTPNLSTAALKRAYLECAREAIFLADSTKLGQVSYGRFAPLEAADILVIDNNISSEVEAALTSRVGRLVVAAQESTSVL